MLLKVFLVLGCHFVQKTAIFVQKMALWGTCVWHYFVFGSVIVFFLILALVAICSAEQNRLCNIGSLEGFRRIIILNLVQWFGWRCGIKIFLILVLLAIL